MAKDTYYFSHDYNARNDPKIRKLISKHGILGYGIFWAIIEDLYQNANALPTDYELIAFDMRTDCEIVKSIINDFDLFIIDGSEFGSSAVESRLIERDKKSGKARESAFKRWNKKNKDANALQTDIDSNANKGKERKVKENKEEKQLVYVFQSDAFKQAWEQWKSYKKAEFKFTYKSIDTEQVTMNSLQTLSGNNEQIAIKIIQQSIANNWKGFFALKVNEANATPEYKPLPIYR